jgi:hypothetical protein
MKKHGVTIDCANCRFIASHNKESFDVIVPVTDEGVDLAGHAKLHCRVSSQTHVVELAEWLCPEAPVISAGSDLDRRLADALYFIAEKRLCGNRNLCPTEVVSVVQKANLPGNR